MRNKRHVGQMGKLGTYAAEVEVSGWWLEPQVDETVILDIEWTVEDESFDAYNKMGESQMYASYGTHVTKVLGAYGKDTGADYSNLLEKSSSHQFLDHLADVVNEQYEC
jgi:hypothetical protein